MASGRIEAAGAIVLGEPARELRAKLDFAEAQDDYVALSTEGKKHLKQQTISSLETALDPQRFLRIHRSIIVNADRITELQPWFRGDYLVILKDGTQLKLSRTYREHLQTRLRAIL